MLEQVRPTWGKWVLKGSLIYTFRRIVEGHPLCYQVTIPIVAAEFSTIGPERFCAYMLRKARRDYLKSIELHMARINRRHEPLVDDDLHIKDY